MRHAAVLLLIPLGIAAAEDGLANLVYLDDRLELHPRVGVAGRYDSNVDATGDDPEDELAGIGSLGMAARFVWSEATTLLADGEARLVVTDRAEQRYRHQGRVDASLRRDTQTATSGVRLGWSRSDDPDAQTGERLLTDTWSADVEGDLTGQVHRLSGGLGWRRSDYLDDSRSFGEDDRDETTYSVTLGYGMKLAGGDELTARVIGDRVDFDRETTNQDNTGVRVLLGWSRQVSETIGLALEGGGEYRRYDANDTLPADHLISPTWQASGRTVTAAEHTWSLTLSGRVEDSISGNPALESRLALTHTRPLTGVVTLRAGVEGYHLDDLESVGGQPLDERWTARATLGTTWAIRPGLEADASGGYDYSDSRLAGDYARVVVLAGLTARF
jgi:hypothetical protein